MRDPSVFGWFVFVNTNLDAQHPQYITRDCIFGSCWRGKRKMLSVFQYFLLVRICIVSLAVVLPCQLDTLLLAVVLPRNQMLHFSICSMVMIHVSSCAKLPCQT